MEGWVKTFVNKLAEKKNTNLHNSRYSELIVIYERFTIVEVYFFAAMIVVQTRRLVFTLGVLDPRSKWRSKRAAMHRELEGLIPRMTVAVQHDSHNNSYDDH